MTKETWFSIWSDGPEGEFWAARSMQSCDDAMRQASTYEGWRRGTTIHGCIRVWIGEDGKLNAEVVKETTE